MEIQVNLEGRKRKELAKIVGELLGAEVSYKGPPSYAFEAGEVTVGRDGTIIFEVEQDKDVETVNRLLTGLQEHGFKIQVIPLPEDSFSEEINPEDDLDGLPFGDDDEEKNPADNPEILPFDPAWPNPEWFNDECSEVIVPESLDKLVIQMPLDGFNPDSLDNLTKLVDSKALLIKKSLGVSALTIRTNDNVLEFPWFDSIPEPQEITAYANLIAALCDMAKRQKRVMAVEKPTDNEKFTFRLFLVRLGLIGDEYAETRKILMRNLSGNGAWKDTNGKSANPHQAKPEKDAAPGYSDKDIAETIYKAVSFIRRLVYFIQHFDD